LVGIKKWPTTAYKFESNVGVTIVACCRERVNTGLGGAAYTGYPFKFLGPDHPRKGNNNRICKETVNNITDLRNMTHVLL
jgi:hypothetical protein